MDEIVITKKTKKSERQIDLKPVVYECEYDAGDVILLLPCGSTENIKPELFIGAYLDYTGLSSDDIKYELTRLELLEGEYPEFSLL